MIDIIKYIINKIRLAKDNIELERVKAKIIDEITNHMNIYSMDRYIPTFELKKYKITDKYQRLNFGIRIELPKIDRNYLPILEEIARKTIHPDKYWGNKIGDVRVFIV